MAGLACAAAVVCMTLPETLNKPTMEDLTQDKKKPMEEHSDNNITNDGKEENNTLIWLRAKNKETSSICIANNVILQMGLYFRLAQWLLEQLWKTI